MMRRLAGKQFLISMMTMMTMMILPVQSVEARSPGIWLVVSEPELGVFPAEWTGDYSATVAPGEALAFTWTGDYSVEVSEGTILGFRYGWDVADVDDPDDPGWANPGYEDVMLAPSRSFQTGIHNFVVRSADDVGRFTWCRIVITVGPPVPVGEHSLGQVKARHHDRG